MLAYQEASSRSRFTWPSAIWLALSAIVVLLLLATFRVVSITYPRGVQNKVLYAPLSVTWATADRLALGDGRVLQVDLDPTTVATLQTPGACVDVVPRGGSDAEVYGEARQFVCGTPWAALVEIPLIPVDVPTRRRDLIALGTVLPPATTSPSTGSPP